MKMNKLFLSLLLIILLTLTACAGSKDESPSAEQVYTQAAQTVQAQLTRIADQQGTATPSPTNTTSPTPVATATLAAQSPSNTSLPSSTPASSCSLRADYVVDITIPDGTELKPGEEFTKTWQLINSGTCTWSKDYRVIFSTGTNMAAATEYPISTVVDVNAGAIINISIPMKAPETPGEYTAYYKLKAANGTVFGINADGAGSFYVQIKVAGALSPSPTP